MENLIVELIRAIRGDKSQNSLSLLLGYEDNRVNRWEKKQRPVYWDDFVRLCEKQKINLSSSLYRFMGYRGELGTSELIHYLTSTLSQKELQEKINTTSQTIGRWKVGKSTPTLENVFDLIESTRDVAIEIIHDIALQSGNMPTEILERFDHKVSVKNLRFNYPEASEVYLCYELSDMPGHQFEDDAHFIRTKIDCDDLEKINKILELMTRLGQIKEVSPGRYQRLPKSKDQTILRSNMELQRNNNIHRLNRALSVLEKSDLQREKFHNLTFTSNEEISNEINEKIRKLFHEIVAYIEETDRQGIKTNCIQTINLQDYILKYPEKSEF